MAHARMSLIFAAGCMSLKYARMGPGNNCKSVTRPIKSCIGALNRYANFSFPKKNHFGRTIFIKDVHFELLFSELLVDALKETLEFNKRPAIFIIQA